MEIPILVEPVAGNGFRATGGEPLALSAEGATRDEAVRRLKDLVEKRMAAGAQILPLNLAGGEQPWNSFVGMFKDDPLFDEWQRAIAERRRGIEQDPEVQ